MAISAWTRPRHAVGLSPGVTQPAKTLLAVRWNLNVLRRRFPASCAPPVEADAGSPKELSLISSLGGDRLKTKLTSLRSKPYILALAEPYLLLDKDAFVVRLPRG